MNKNKISITQGIFIAVEIIFRTIPKTSNSSSIHITNSFLANLVFKISHNIIRLLLRVIDMIHLYKVPQKFVFFDFLAFVVKNDKN